MAGILLARDPQERGASTTQDPMALRGQWPGMCARLTPGKRAHMLHNRALSGLPVPAAPDRPPSHCREGALCRPPLQPSCWSEEGLPLSPQRGPALEEGPPGLPTLTSPGHPCSVASALHPHEKMGTIRSRCHFLVGKRPAVWLPFAGRSCPREGFPVLMHLQKLQP